MTATFPAFIAALAARTPAPAGGAAAARAASMGTALFAMVLRIAADRPSNAERRADVDAAIAVMDRLIAGLAPLDEADSAAFGAVLEACRMPKDTAEAQQARAAAIDATLRIATQVPTHICAACAEAMRAIEPVADCIGRNIVADLATGTELLLAAARSARLMVATNATSFADQAAGPAARDIADALVTEVTERHARLSAHAIASIDRS